MEQDVTTPPDHQLSQETANNKETEQPLPPNITVDDTVMDKTATPYVASLAAFGLLLLSTFFSIETLVNFVIEKWLVKPQKDSGLSYFDFSTFEIYVVVGAIALLTISIPVLLLLVKIIRRAEDKEIWRFKQKWRRIIYNILIVAFILTIVSILVGMVTEILNSSLKLYELGYDYTTSSKPDTNGQLLAAVVSGAINVLLAGIVLSTVLFEYVHKYRKIIWSSLGILIITSALFGGFAVMHVNKTVSDAKAEREKEAKSYSNYDYSSLYNSSDTTNTTDMKTELDNIKSDLSYYSYDNNGKYPTTDTWNSSSFKSQYLYSDESTLKKVTYTPSGCDTTSCTSYILTAKDESGKDIEVTP